MVLTRKSPDHNANSEVSEFPAEARENNSKWFQRTGCRDGVILIGGTTLGDFRLRVAQSHLRCDMLPSFWSTCGILISQKGEPPRFAMAGLDVPRDLAEVPMRNAVQIYDLREFENPVTYPNIAVISFAKEHNHAHRDIKRVATHRGFVDLPSLILPWLAYIWGTPGCNNPLLNSVGLPSAAFVETVFAMSGFDLTPGLASAASCPEAIWQSARWWGGFYAALQDSGGEASPKVPTGKYTIRQPAAAVVREPKRANDLLPDPASSDTDDQGPDIREGESS